MTSRQPARPRRTQVIVSRLAVDDNALRCYVPKGYTGFLLLSATGREVFWTGRVAIGLRYTPPARA
jgi:hypothetical protein